MTVALSVFYLGEPIHLLNQNHLFLGFSTWAFLIFSFLILPPRFDCSSGKLDTIFVKANPFLVSRNGVHGATPRDLSTRNVSSPKAFGKTLRTTPQAGRDGFLGLSYGSGNAVIEISFPVLNKMEIILRTTLVLHHALCPMSQNFRSFFCSCLPKKKEEKTLKCFVRLRPVRKSPL